MTTAIDLLRGILNGFRDLNSKGIYTMNGTETDLLRQILLEVQALSIGVGIADGSVTTPKIADLNVTEPKLAVNSVTTAKIPDANVTPAKLSRPYSQGASFSLTGVSSDVTGIPSWATQIRLKFRGLSTNGTSTPIIQLGDSGGIETTGYFSAVAISTSVPSTNAVTALGGLALSTTVAAASLISGLVSIDLIDSATNLWSMSMAGFFEDNPPTVLVQSFATKSLSGVLDRLRITTFGGTDLFDAGICSVSWQ